MIVRFRDTLSAIRNANIMQFFSSREIFFGDYFLPHRIFRIPAEVIDDERKIEIELCESVLNVLPDDIETLKLVGHRYTETGDYYSGLEADLKLSRLRAEDPLVWYNLACSYALLEQAEEAVSALSKAADLGYDDVGHMEQDADLDNIRNEDAYISLIQRLRAERKAKK